MRRLRACVAQAGFTIVEVVAGATILGLVSASVIFGMSQLNSYATVNRLYTAAQVLAQNQIDLLLTMGPFDPSAVPAKFPVWAACGEATATNTILRVDQPYYYDPTATGCPLSVNETAVPLYRDPMAPSGSATVMCTIKTRVTDTGTTVPVNGVDTSLDLRRATVVVAYKYRSRDYSVVMETMRTSDQ